MKQKRNIWKVIILIVVILGILVGALMLYNKLSNSALGGKEGETVHMKEGPAGGEDESMLPDEQAKDDKGTEKLADFTVYDSADDVVKLSEKIAEGKPIVLNFWASWCGPCRMEMGSFDKAFSKYGDRIEFMMVNLTGSSGESVEGATAFIQEEGYKFPVYFDKDQEGDRAAGISSIPLSIFLDEEGNVAGTHVGAMTYNMLDEALKGLLGD